MYTFRFPQLHVQYVYLFSSTDSFLHNTFSVFYVNTFTLFFLVAPPIVSVAMATSSFNNVVYFASSLILSCVVDVGYHADTPTLVVIDWYHGNEKLNETSGIDISNVMRLNLPSSLFISNLTLSSVTRNNANGSLGCIAMAIPMSNLSNAHVIASHPMNSSITVTVISKGLSDVCNIAS